MVEYRKEPVDCFGLILIVKKNLIGYHSDEVVRRSTQEPWKPKLYHHEPSSNRSKNLWKQISGSSIFYLFLHLELLFFNKFCCLTRQTYSNEIKLESRRSEKKIPRHLFFSFSLFAENCFSNFESKGGRRKSPNCNQVPGTLRPELLKWRRLFWSTVHPSRATRT